MSLTITDALGTDLVANPPDLDLRRTAGKTGLISIYCVVTEDDTTLPAQLVAATLDWNDGSAPVSYDPVPSPLVISTARTLPIGFYEIRVNASNSLAPTPKSVVARFLARIVPFALPAVPPRRIFGPILPSDDGNPSAQNWAFDMGSDLQIIMSSVKMLLITAKGERIMLPGYGTNLRRILFEANIDAVDAIVQQEIGQALSTWEPRAQLRSLAVVRDPNSRSVHVQASFTSRIENQPFDLGLQFT